MKDTLDRSTMLFKLMLLLVPVIPYYRVLPEVINPLIFLYLSVIFLLRRKTIIERKEKYLLLLFFFCIISVFVSKDKIISFFNCFPILIAPLIYFICSTFTREETEESLIYILYGGGISSLINIIINLIIPSERLNGLFNYANTSALYYAVCIVIYYGLYESKLIAKRKALFNVSLLITNTALFLTQSRGGIIIYLSALILLCALNKKKRVEMVGSMLINNVLSFILAYILMKNELLLIVLVLPFIIYFAVSSIKVKAFNNKFKIGILGVSIIGFIFMFLITFKRFLKVGLHSAEFQERLVFWQDGIKAVKQNFFGIGAGRWGTEQFLYQSALYDVKYVHNSFIQLALDYGVIFLLIFAGVVIYIISSAIRNKKVEKPYWIIILMILIHSFVDFSLSFIYINIILWFCIAAMNKLNDSEEMLNNKPKRFVFNNLVIGILIIINMAIVVLVPGEILYNAAILNSDGESCYKTLNLWTRFPFKSERYYDKAATVSYNMYSENKDKQYLERSMRSIDESTAYCGATSRTSELLGKMNFSSERYMETAINLEKSIELRKYNMTIYDALIECYYRLYKNGDITAEEYFNKVKKIEGKITLLSKELTSKAKYMKNQPDGKLNDFEKIRIAQGYKAVGNLEEYNNYLKTINEQSQAYIQLKDEL